MPEATVAFSRFHKRQRRMAAKAKKSKGPKNFKNYPVRDELWQLMNEKEREVVEQTRAYKDEIDFLLHAEQLAVAALIEHHEKERKDLIEAWRISTNERMKVMNRAWMRLDAARKRKKLARIAGIKKHRKRGGGNLMKKPARQA